MQVIARLLVVSVGVVTPAQAAQTDRAALAADATATEAIHDHLDQAENALEGLLDWRHVITSASRQPRETPVPTAPMTTLITVPRGEVERLSKLIDAAAATVPRPQAAAGAGPRGDLRSHLEKAQEIARELMSSATDRPGGASATAGVVVDRAALERLEVELDAAERVAPRRLAKP